MDMHAVDMTMTGLSRAARERVPELKHMTPTQEGSEARGDEQADGPARGTEPKDQTDRVEISDVSKMLAALSEQQDDSGDLQLPTDKLRRMIEG